MPILTGYPVSAFGILSGSSDLTTVGGTFRVDPTFDGVDSRITVSVTDADSLLEGDASSNEVGDDSSQSAVVTDGGGSTIASGQIYLEGGRTVTAPDGSTITLYSMEIGGTKVGWLAQPELQPGVTYEVASSFNIDGAIAPTYASFTDTVDYDPDVANVIDGGGLADDLQGGAGDDSIDGAGGSDTIYGGDGNDDIDGGSDNDTLYGGAGDDLLNGGFGDNILYGGTGADTFNLMFGGNTFYGGDDGDVFNIGFGTDTIFAGDGGDDSDTLSGAVADDALTITLTGSGTGTFSDADGDSGAFEGIETFELTSGADTFVGSSATEDVTIQAGDGADSIATGAGEDSISGGGGGDLVYGGGADDSVTGDAGTDTIYGGVGADTVDSGGDDDAVFGGNGSDSIAGGNGRDDLYGGNNDDVLDGGDSADLLYGGSGNDVIYGGEDANFLDHDTLYGGDGDDQLFSGDNAGTNLSDGDFLYAGAGNDTLQGGAANDTLYGGDDADAFIIEDGFGTDIVYGGEGGIDSDTLDLDALGTGATITLNTGEDGTLTDGTDTATFEGIENFILTSQDDFFDGSEANASNPFAVQMGGGDDRIIGGLADDLIYGGDGSDLIEIEDDFGADVIYGGEGGADNDTLDLSALGGGVTISFTGEEEGTFTDGTDTGTFFGIENIILTDQDDQLDASNDTAGVSLDAGVGNDSLVGGDGADLIYAGSGADTINTGVGADTVYGGAGEDQITDTAGPGDLFAGAGNDQITSGGHNDEQYGGDGNDTLSSQAGIDTLYGGADDDLLYAGVRDDTLYGGSGNDTLFGGAGDDTLTGGTGDDTFAVDASGGSDTITDFGDGDDQLSTAALSDVGNVLTNQDGLVTADEITVSGGGGSNQVLTFPSGEAINVPDGTIDTSTQQTQFASLVAMGVPACFAPGTLILTEHGEVPVEDLWPGDRFVTADRGLQTLRWIGRRKVTFDAGNARAGKDKPIEFKAGALGGGLPRRRLIVSPQHRIVLAGKTVLAKHGMHEVLALAKGLTRLEDVRVMKGKRAVEYYSLLFDRHEIIFAEGAPTESFRPGHIALADFAPEHREEIYAIYPGLRDDPRALGPPARPIVSRQEAEALVREIRVERNVKDLVDSARP
ncbi:MAG: Hint domain-containing protein [Paracoccaceae bacterium]